MIFFAIILLVLGFQLTKCNNFLEIGDECEVFGKSGECKLSPECPFYLSILNNSSLRFGMTKKRCASSATSKYISVCCPARKSLEACDNLEGRLPSFQSADNIHGGSGAKPGDFPSFAALGYQQTNETLGFHCGGVLISKKFILTAAHCLQNNLVTARLGTISLISTVPSEVNIRIKVGKKV